MLDVGRGDVLAAAADAVREAVDEYRLPSSSIRPTSPVWNHRFRNASIVRSGIPKIAGGERPRELRCAPRSRRPPRGAAARRCRRRSAPRRSRRRPGRRRRPRNGRRRAGRPCRSRSCRRRSRSARPRTDRGSAARGPAGTAPSRPTAACGHGRARSAAGAGTKSTITPSIEEWVAPEARSRSSQRLAEKRSSSRARAPTIMHP